MSEPGDEIFFQIGGILHEARMQECYGKMDMASRKKWPETFKDFRRQRMDGQPWIDVAITQVRALIKTELLGAMPYSPDRPYYPHEVYCSAGRSEEIGCSGCSCRAGREIKRLRALLAQRIEHEPSKLGVEGSNPSECASSVPSDRDTATSQGK